MTRLHAREHGGRRDVIARLEAGPHLVHGEPDAVVGLPRMLDRCQVRPFEGLARDVVVGAVATVLAAWILRRCRRGHGRRIQRLTVLGELRRVARTDGLDDVGRRGGGGLRGPSALLVSVVEVLELTLP